MDCQSWQTLLQLLRRRRTRPFSDVLVSLPVEALRAVTSWHSSTSPGKPANTGRKFIGSSASTELSKANKVPGFAESDQLSREEADQVLGITFRPEQVATEMATLRDSRRCCGS